MKINVEVMPWLSSSMRPGIRDGKIELTYELAGSTLRDLLEELTSRDPAFGAVIYDQKAGSLYGHALVAVNDQLLESSSCYEMKLKDRNKVCFFPIRLDG